MSKIELCVSCLTKLKEAAARGGSAGSREDKMRASRMGVEVRQLKALKLTFDGYTLSIQDWATKLGISRKTIYRRMAMKLPTDKILAPHGAEHLPVL